MTTAGTPGEGPATMPLPQAAHQRTDPGAATPDAGTRYASSALGSRSGGPAAGTRYSASPAAPAYAPALGGDGPPAGPQNLAAQWARSRPPPRPRRRWRWLKRLLQAAIVLILLGGLVFAGLLVATPAVGNAPALAQAFDRAHQAAYPGPPVPVRFRAALVATEDHRFYSEYGVDPFAIARVIAGTITRRPDQGGATLYQQLAKMLYTPGRSGFTVQAEQVVLGIKLNADFSKRQILQMYSDVAYFGHGYYGLAAASCGYFGKTPAGLTWPQAALLAGLVQAPSAYDPLAHYAAARARQAHVLARLAVTGWLTPAEAAQAYHRPLHLTGGAARGCGAG
jgi:membrane peptidoglycan carboxypeptidase